MNTNVSVTTVLVALAVGVALPVLVQVFITLRTANRVLVSLDRRLDAVLGELTRVVGRLEPSSSEQHNVASIIGAAVVPAIAAAVRTLRHRDAPAPGAELAKGGDAASAGQG